ncbi:MAG: PAS domain S-box protein [Deltaproteobacteria bacterium]|nr:PAS domain S-box protein [Deltaproteobacteria bacterium]
MRAAPSCGPGRPTNNAPIFTGGTMDRHRKSREQLIQELMETRLRALSLEKRESQLKKALESLAEERERLAVTLRSISEGVITTDMNGRIVFLNAAAGRLIGRSKEQAVGRLLSEVIHIIHEEGGTGNLDTLLDTTLTRNRMIELAAASTLVSLDGTTRIVSISVSPLHDRTGTISGVVLVLRDITEKKALENELFKVQKLESLGLLAGGIAHDFNNLLTAILGNISLAKCLTPPESTVRSRLDQAEKATDRAADLARQLLTFARGGVPVKKSVAPARLLTDSANFALHGANVSCEFTLPDTLWPVEADPGQINQVVNNLVINAVQAMPDGGRIHIRAENVLLSKKGTIPLRSGRYVRIAVEDSGIGIPEEIRQQIFDPYFTTKPYGNGLGLSTTYSIVRNHGGHITVESTPGSGTTFLVYLPASDRLPMEAIIEDEKFTDGRGRVLVMDDEEMIRNVAVEMLRHMGYQAVSCANGDEAVSLYREAMESGKPFHAVLMDLTIPGGMGGEEAVRYLLGIDPDVRALVSSGYSDCQTIDEYRDHGFWGVVAKPYTIRELHRALRETL